MTTAISLRDAARELDTAGVCVVPTREDGSKAPDSSWAAYQVTRSTPAEHDGWFGNGRRTGIGVVYGAVSGNVEMIEFEGRAIAEGVLEEVTELMEVSGLGSAWRAITSGWVTESPSGGRHFRVRIDGGPVPGNTKLASRLAREDEYTAEERQRVTRNPRAKILRGLIETRGEGGFGIVDPSRGSVHPSGKPYLRIAGAPNSIPTLDAHVVDAVRNVCRMVDAVPHEVREEPAPRTGTPREEGVRPGDDYEAKTDWADILEPEGWTRLHQHGGTRYWTRPGKDDGISASTGRASDRDRLYVFSTSTEFDAEKPYTKFGAYALLHHAGDHKAAAKALGALGYGSRGPQTAPEGPAEPVHDGHVPEEFWAARPAFQHIRDAAHSKGCGGDVVLFGVLARLAAMLPVGLTVNSGIRTPASLNLGVALMGQSGNGKSEGNEVAELLFPALPWLTPDNFQSGLPLGSGEGIAEMYMGDTQEDTGEVHTQGQRKGEPKTKLVRKQVRHNALVYSDEGESLLKMLERTGSTIGATVRSALTGGTLGQSNGRRETTRIIPKGSYAFALVIGFQPERVGPLLDDAPAGTPQRFLYVWAADPSLPRKPPEWPGQLLPDIQKAIVGGGGGSEGNPFEFDQTPEVKRPMEVCQAARDELYEHNWLKNRGEHHDDPMDSHWPVMRLKLAALLALLDERYDVTDEDWQLSKVLWDASCAVRDSLVRQAEQEAQRQMEAQDERHVKREVRAHLSKRSAESDGAERVARAVAKRVHEAGADGMTQGAISRELKSGTRPLLPDAIRVAEDFEWITVKPGGRSPLILPGTSRPS